MEVRIKHYLISGRVQGVGFRAFTVKTATAMGLLGWVRNLADGRVEAVAHGRSEVILKFEAALRKGPPGCSVQSMVVTDWVGTTDFAEFSIRKDKL